MDPVKIIQKYYDKNSKLYKILIDHSTQVKNKALDIANRVPELNPDKKFIKEAAMLHDIGIYLTKAKGIECNGNEPYLKHGMLGEKILEKEGYPKHAKVCANHVGVGITQKEIDKRNLPIVESLPKTVEEEIISFADCFFSKTIPGEKSINQIREELSKFGKEDVNKFNEWCIKFKEIKSNNLETFI